MLNKNNFTRLLLSLGLCCSLDLIAKHQTTIKEITSEQELLNLRPAIIEFYRPNSINCANFEKDYEALAKQYPQFHFLRLNSEKNIGLTLKYNIDSIPSFALIGSNDQIPFKILIGGHKKLLEKAVQELIDLEKQPKKVAPIANTTTALELAEITNLSELENIINNSSTPVIALSYADWCGHCINFKPKFEQLSHQNSAKATFVKINEKHAGNREIYQKHGVGGFPTMLIFNAKQSAQPSQKIVGANQPALELFLNSL